MLPILAPKSNVKIDNKIAVPVNPTYVTISGELTNDPIIDTESSIDVDTYDNSKVTYLDLMLKFTELCRTVQNDQAMC